MNKFHYIVAGAGCAGLSFLVRLLQTGRFSGKRILLIDQSLKNVNDRTWCYWEKTPGLFDHIVHKSWQQLWLCDPMEVTLHDIAPYTYKMIRGIDFYQYCLQFIHKYPNVVIEQATIQRIENKGNRAILETSDQLYEADHIFSSIMMQQPLLKKGQYHLLQHFKGWVIETPEAVFNPAEATLMDFRVSQERGTAFVYVMPFTPHRALVEYTLFTNATLNSEEYDAGLKNYIHTFLKTTNYTIQEEEFGIIPMTNYRFPSGEGAITWLGTAGGQTKASSGYTFQFIQKQTAQLVDAILRKGKPAMATNLLQRRFHWYDSILLNVLAQNKLPGAFIFTELFRKNQITDVLQFLDNETSLLQEINIITVLPKRVFLRAALQQLT